MWFLYEWLLQARLDLPNASSALGYCDALDPKLQFAATAERSPRHRVRNNLPGTPQFCPLAFRNEVLTAFLEHDVAAQARMEATRVPADALARAAAFLLLADARSSFAIEGEQPSPTRIQDEETVVRDLPQETRFLAAYDRFAKRTQEIVDMPAGTVDLLFRFLRQNGGTLSARARRHEFAALDEDEVRRVEAIYAEEFEVEDQHPERPASP